MKNFRSALASLSLGAFLFSTAGFSAQGFVKMSPEEFRRTLTQRCLKTEGCKPVEIDRYVDGVTRELQMTQGHFKLLERGGVEGSIEEIIRRVQETGVEVVSVTIKVGEKVVEVTGDQLERLYALPVVQAMVRGGEKTLELTVQGVEYSYDLTVKLSKKVGIYQLTEITVRTLGDVTSEVLSHAAKGTVKAIEYVVTSKPVVLVFDGMEYLAKKVHFGEVADQVFDWTWQSVEVFSEGTWNAVKFVYKGTLFFFGLPVEFVKWVVEH
jgi:hypothetical protein